MTNNCNLPFVADATTTTMGRITPLWGIGSINSRSNFGGKKLNTNTRTPGHIDNIKKTRRNGANRSRNTLADFQNGIVSHIVEGLDIELSHGWRF